MNEPRMSPNPSLWPLAPLNDTMLRAATSLLAAVTTPEFAPRRSLQITGGGTADTCQGLVDSANTCAFFLLLLRLFRRPPHTHALAHPLNAIVASVSEAACSSLASALSPFHCSLTARLGVIPVSPLAHRSPFALTARLVSLCLSRVRRASTDSHPRCAQLRSRGRPDGGLALQQRRRLVRRCERHHRRHPLPRGLRERLHQLLGRLCEHRHGRREEPAHGRPASVLHDLPGGAARGDGLRAPWRVQRRQLQHAEAGDDLRVLPRSQRVPRRRHVRPPAQLLLGVRGDLLRVLRGLRSRDRG